MRISGVLIALETEMELWKSIIQGNLVQLLELENQFLAHAKDREIQLLFYARVLISYYREDRKGIENWIEFYQSQSPEFLILISHIRMQILEPLPGSVQKISEMRDQIFSLTEDPKFRGESLFVSAYYFQMKGEFQMAEVSFRESAAYFEKAGVQQKALRAQMSAIAAFSCSHPKARLFTEYLYLYEKAKLINESLTAATCLLNISREFQLLDGYELALEYVSSAIELLEKSHFGSREHGLCLVQRAHLLIQLKRQNEIGKDVLFALSISHPDVQSSCQSLAQMYDFNLKTLPHGSPLPTWQERETETKKTRVLGKLEMRLIHLLSQRPHNKHELMNLLYGELIDFTSKENRFKNLLYRVRSRTAAQIHISGEEYILREPSPLPRKLG